MTGFEKRPLGRTTLEVTAFGLGCATLGGSRVSVSREDGEAIVRAAWAAGVRYVDTAPYYGFGQAERCVGDALREMPRDEWVLSTKVGRLLRAHASLAATEHRLNRMPFDAVFDYSYDAVMRSFEDILQRLGLGRIDILYVHDAGAMQHGREAHPAIMRTFRDGGYRALEELRRRGAVRAIGIGVNEREILFEAMEWGAWDAFLLAGRYTCSSRRRSMISSRNAFHPAYRSLLAARSIPGFSLDATPGTTNQRRPKSSPG
jgi:D-threo-aldose 1-dehydrogenase